MYCSDSDQPRPEYFEKNAFKACRHLQECSSKHCASTQHSNQQRIMSLSSGWRGKELERQGTESG